jgi:hypothetical protein
VSCVCVFYFFLFLSKSKAEQQTSRLFSEQEINEWFMSVYVCIPPCGADDKLDDFSLPVYMRKIVSVKKYIVVV